MSKQAKLALGVLVGAIAIAALMFLLRPEPEQTERVERAPLVQAVPLTPASGSIPVLAQGSVEPVEQVEVAAEIGGRVAYLNPDFIEGGAISNGAPLFRIDASDYRNAVRAAEADVAAQDVAVLQASEEVRIAREELERFRGRSGGTFGQAIDNSDYAARILPPEGRTSTPTATANRSPTPNRLATREPQLRSARAAAQRARANLADARLALGRTTVRAPFAGIVQQESLSPGTIVQPGQVVGTLVSTNAYEVRVSLTEDEASLIPGLLRGGRGIPARVFATQSGRTFRWDAVVSRANRLLDAETRTVDVFLRVANPLSGGELVGEASETVEVPPLLLGSFVEATITGTVPGRYFAVPTRFLRPGNVLWIVRDGKLRIVEVEVIQRGDRTAYVRGPSIGDGALLVTSSLRAPVNGMAVRVSEGAAE